MKIKLPIVLFDLGNVLVHVHYSRFLETLGLDHSLDETDLLGRMTPEGLLYESGRLTTDLFFQQLNARLGGGFETQRLHAAWKAILDGEIDGMLEIVQRTAKQTPIYLLSNTNDLHFADAVVRFPILAPFTDYFVSYRIGAMKPSPVIYDHVIRTLGCEPQSLLFFDDLEKNVESARRSGMGSVLVASVEDVHQALVAEGFSID